MPSKTMAADGSSLRDGSPRVEIDASDPTSRWRFSCPNGHTTIDPTDGGVWCRACAHDIKIEDPHHTELLDKRTGETIPWSSVDWK